MNRAILASLALSASLSGAAQTTDVASLPTAARWGGGDTVGSKLIGNAYVAGNGPGLWITSMGGYRVYLDGQLLAWDNQPGRIRFVPLTVLPGSHALSVVGINHGTTPGVLVQLDELDSSHVSSAGWKVSNSPTDATWKTVAFSDAAWSSASASGAATARPDLKTLSGWASGSSAKWIWSSSSADTAVVLRTTFKIAPIGFGAATTGGAGGDTVIASTAAAIKTALQASGAKVILVPEGIYDFRNVRDDANGTYKWCTRACASTDGNPASTYYRVTFDGTCGTGETIAASVNRWETWITLAANKSLIGMGRGAKLRGASLYVRGAESASNVVFRNLAVYDVNPHMVEADDGISAVNTSKVWIDHCSFKWISDGNDLGGSTGSKEISVTWSVYDGLNHLNCYKYDPYVALLEDIDVTYAWDSWKSTMGRVPKVVSATSKSRVHIYGNAYDFNNFFLVGPHGTSSYSAEVLWESNYVNDAKGYLTMKGPYGLINARNNTYAGTVGTFQNEDAAGARTVTTEPHDSVFTPSYGYALPTSVAALPALLDSLAGIGGRWDSLPAYDAAAAVAKLGPSVTVAATAGSTAPASLSLTATVTAGGSSVSKVEFWLGDSLLGSDASSPYAFTGTVTGGGTWSVVAVATDATGLATMSAPVTFTVTGGPAVPVFTSAKTASVAENTTFVLQNTAIDANGDAVRFRISGGADWTKFAIDSLTGKLSFATAPDYEAPADAGKDNVYNVTILATDGTLSSTQAVAVTVTNAVDAPTITSASAVDVAENVQFVVGVVGADASGATVTYGLLASADSAKFILSSTSGNLYFIKAPDYETPLDSAKANLYHAKVGACNATGCDTQVVAITVTNVVEAPTVAITAPARGASVTAGQALSLTASLADPDKQVRSVAFYHGDTLVASDTGSPYAASWSAVPAGTWTLVAKALDSSKAVLATSDTVSFLAVQAVGVNPMLASLVAVEVEWLDVQGNRIGRGSVLVNPASPQMRAPAGMRGVLLASFRLPDGSARLLRTVGMEGK